MRLIPSSGTTLSIGIAHYGEFERSLQRNSMGRLHRFAEPLIVTCDGVADDTVSL